MDPTNIHFPPYVTYITKTPQLCNDIIEKEPDLASYVSLSLKQMRKYLELSEPVSTKHFSYSRYERQSKVKKEIEIEIFNLFEKIKKVEKNPIDCFLGEKKEMLLRYLALCSDDKSLTLLERSKNLQSDIERSGAEPIMPRST